MIRETELAPDDALIPAATVMLLREASGLEVLMVERNADMGFAGGALVFPGGRVDPADGDPAWAEHCTGLDCTPRLAAAKIAAIRESFEEAGLLLARRQGEDALVDDSVTIRLNDWRDAVVRDDRAFFEMVRREKLTLACDYLVAFSHWIGPRGLHRRFDTMFFVAQAPARQSLREDGEETTEAVWITPGAAIEARASGARKIIFPTARNLELLALSPTVGHALDHASMRTIRPIEPVVTERDGARLLTIPDDLGYPVTEEALLLAMRG